MSGTRLAEIFELLPEACQERTILDCMESMFARGEWEKVENFLDCATRIRGHQEFKGMAIGIGVKCAVRARNFALAVERLELLSRLDSENELIKSRADALLQLAIQLLPDNPTPVARFWHHLLAADLRNDTQRIVGHIGFLLANAYGKQGDTANREAVMQSMRSTMDESVISWLEKQFRPHSRNGH